MPEVTNDAIDKVVEQALPLPIPDDFVTFYAIGGAINQVDEGRQRTPTGTPHTSSRWRSSEAIPATMRNSSPGAREFHEAMAPYGTDGEYVTNQTNDGPECVRTAYGDNYERLVEGTNEWDPENLFHLNQNIEPTV